MPKMERERISRTTNKLVKAVPRWQTTFMSPPPFPRRMLGKVALITGAASGIGKATAHRLAAEGAKTALADLNESEVTRVAEAILQSGGTAVVLKLDVTSELDWQGAIDRILAHFGRLDVCVNCAGISFSKPISEISLAEWRHVLATNLDGAFLGTKHALQAMKASGGGCILNVASAAGIKPLAGNAAYGTSKAAVRFLTRVAALEAAPHHIRVNSVSPGAIATPLWEGTPCWPEQVATKEGRGAALDVLVSERGFGRPEEIASALVFLASEEARLVTGADLPVDAGFSAG